MDKKKKIWLAVLILAVAVGLFLAYGYYKDCRENISGLRSEMNKEKIKNSMLSLGKQTLEKEIELAGKKAADAEKNIKKLEKEHKECRQELISAEKTLRFKINRCEQDLAKARETTAISDTVKTDLDKKQAEDVSLNALEAKLKTLKESLEETKTEKETIKKKNTLLEDKTKTLNERLSAGQKNIYELEAKLKALEKETLNDKTELSLAISLVDQYLLEVLAHKPLLLETFYYQTGSSWLLVPGEEAKIMPLLKKISGLNTADKFIKIIGFSDSQLYITDHEYNNLKLSANRAVHFAKSIINSNENVKLEIEGVNNRRANEKKIEIWLLPNTAKTAEDILLKIKEQFS